MPRRDEEAFKHERVAFEADMTAARLALELGDISTAVDLAVSPSHQYWYGKDPLRFKLLQDLYKLVSDPIDESAYVGSSWQSKLIAELYSIWPKLHLDGAILKQDFPEAEATVREQVLATLDIDDKTYASVRQAIHETRVSGAESVQLAQYSSGLTAKRWGALSRGKNWLKFWDLETGEIIRAEEQGLPMLASAVGRDGSHVLSSFSWSDPEAERELNWSVNFRETYRTVNCLRAGTYQKSEYENVRYYKIRGEIVRRDGEREVEVSREEFEKRTIRGEKVPGPDFKKFKSPGYREYVRNYYSPEEAEAIFAEHKAAEERAENFVRIKTFGTLTIAHDEIDGYLPAGETTFVARSNEHWGLKVDDLHYGDRIIADLAVEDDESWIETIVSPGHGLRGMYSAFDSPITELCISSEGALGLANGHGPTFGIWNLWTGDRLREFHGHEGRVTCLCPSIDTSVVVSGSEDRTVRLWNSFSAECLRVFKGHEHTISKVCISLDATKILSADRGGVIRLWDAERGECLRTIQAHSDNVSGLHLMLDDKFAASASWDQTVKVWNLRSGSCLKQFEFDDWATSVTMTPDGRYLLASSYEGTRVWELIWRLEPKEPAEWDEGARAGLEILMNSNAGWEGKLGTCLDMTEAEIKDSLRRMGPGWTKGHSPHKKEDWYRVWHLDWNYTETLGYAGWGWLTCIDDEWTKIVDDWNREHPRA